MVCLPCTTPGEWEGEEVIGGGGGGGAGAV